MNTHGDDQNSAKMAEGAGRIIGEGAKSSTHASQMKSNATTITRASRVRLSANRRLSMPRFTPSVSRAQRSDAGSWPSARRSVASRAQQVVAAAEYRYR